MTKEEAIEELKQAKLKDTEMGHYFADNVLCDFLISLGYTDVVEEYRKVDKWFA